MQSQFALVVYRLAPTRTGEGSNMFGPWIRFCLDATMLAIEAQTVIALRLIIMLGAGGAAAQAEAHRVVAENSSARPLPAKKKAAEAALRCFGGTTAPRISQIFGSAKSES